MPATPRMTEDELVEALATSPDVVEGVDFPPPVCDDLEFPTMAEMSAMDTPLVGASLFAGIGGSSTGYRAAGIKIGWANEFLPEAADLYRANWPDTVVDTRDVREVDGAEILDALDLDVGELDLLDGSPPCQPFSTAGRRAAGWGKVTRAADGTTDTDKHNLIPEWSRLVAEVRPRVAVMENVRGLTTGTAKGVLVAAVAALREAGYSAGVRVLEADWLGVPQTRHRTYLVGVRDDVGDGPVWPRRADRRWSIGDACPWLDPTSGVSRGLVDGGLVPHPGRTPLRWVDHGAWMRPDHATYRRWQSLPRGGQHPVTFSLVTITPNRPWPTVTTVDATRSSAKPLLASEPRSPSIEETRRICGFPADYRFLLGGDRDPDVAEVNSPYQVAIRRLGNSVVPPMARAVGLGVAKVLGW